MLLSTSDAFELMRVLEDLVSPIIPSGDDAYGHLDCVAKIFTRSTYADDSKEVRTIKALEQIDVVRSALAVYLARCFCSQF
jgi:hypothetical protein